LLDDDQRRRLAVKGKVLPIRLVSVFLQRTVPS
jgi:hypothetical protein